MNPSPVFVGMVEKGRFKAEDVKAFRAAFFSHEGKRVKVKVSRWTKERTSPQNKYYFGVVVKMVGDAIGEEDDQTVHEMLKAEFNYEILVIGDKEIKLPRSTAKLETVQFEEYLAKVKKWASEFLSLYIPEPGEVE